jgi:prefoldin subunit 5
MHVVIDDEQKELLKEYVESNPEFETLSHFLRVSAIREMKDEKSSDPSTEVIDQLNQLQNQIDELATEVQGINARLDSGGTDVSLIAEDVRRELTVLPVPTTETVASSDRTRDQLQTQLAYDIVGNNETTLQELAQNIGESEKDIKRAIDHLKRNHIPIVEKVLEDGKKHFFKQGERR